MKYNSYPSYRDSGVEWLGDVPSGWKTTALKHSIKLQGGYAFKSDLFQDSGIPIIRIGDIKKEMEWNNTKRIPPENKVSTEFIIKPQDTLIALSGATTGKTCFISEVPELAYINQRVARLEYHNKFFYYVLNSDLFQKNILLSADGSAQENISNTDIENMMLSVPSSKEQQTIANYLDTATAKIDTLIAKQTKLIELLKEKRQALISTAVTKGLDSSVAMKDSGVEWLGEIPEHWEMKNVKYLLNNHVGIKIGPFGSSLKLDDMTRDGYKVYGQENVIKRNFNIGHRFICETKFKSMIVYKMEPGDILITMMGTIGKCIVVPREHHIGIIDSHLIKIRTNELMLPAYFVMMIDKSNVVKTQLQLNSKGSIMQGLNSSIIKSLLFPLPSIQEQHKILTHIEEKSSKIDTLISKSTKAIELLKEKRTALISSAVTGRIDVREIA